MDKINYEDYQKTIKKMAYKFLYTGIEIEELISAGNEEFCKIQKTFDSSKSCFNTYLYIRLRGLFLDMKRKHIFKKRKEGDSELSYGILYNQKQINNPERMCIFADIIRELPNDAKEIIKIIFNTPIELIEMIPKKQPRGISKDVLKHYLYKRGWGWSRVFAAFDQIKAIWD
jgi:RNA polymerase sigma factor (sigma-70 family)